MCNYCEIVNASDGEQSPFNQQDYDGLINDVFIGFVTVHNLPTSFYIKTAGHLNKGVFEGFGKDLITIEWGSPDRLLLQDLTENIYMFSGAKTYQQVRYLTDLLINPELKSSFYKFKQEAQPILTEYNEAYLKAEFNTAKSSSRMAAEWHRIEENKDLLPLLEYDTVGDGRVRPEHAILDKIIRPVGDKFWDTLYPPNGWNCRCRVIQLSEGTPTDLRGKGNLYENVPKSFRMNAGKDRVVFREKGKDKHPYFDVAKGDKELAKKNFNLPIPKDGR